MPQWQLHVIRNFPISLRWCHVVKHLSAWHLIIDCDPSLEFWNALASYEAGFHPRMQPKNRPY